MRPLLHTFDGPEVPLSKAINGVLNKKYDNTDKAVMIVCYAWLGPAYLEPCQKLLWLIFDELPDSTLKDLRKPIIGAGHFTEFRDFLGNAISRGRHLPEMGLAAKHLLGHDVLADKDPDVVEWFRSVIKTRMMSSADLSREDAEKLVEYARSFDATFYEDW